MKKIILALSLSLFVTFTKAAAINFLDNPSWSTVLAKAKKENKIIFLDAYAIWCGPCKNMDSQIYTNQAVADYYNANFINVKYDMEKGEGPKLASLFHVTAYPSLIFISPDGKMMHKGVGFKEAHSFIALGKTAKEQAVGFLNLKQKALQLTNAQFNAFVTQAIALEDEDLPQICEQYLSKQSDILGNADLIDIVMNGVNLLPTEKELDYFAANTSKITATGKYTATAVIDKLVALTLGYALSNVVQKQPDKLNFEPVKMLLEKYVPERSFFVLNYYQTQYYFEQNNQTEAIKYFKDLLANTPVKISYEQMCMVLMNFGPTLAKYGELEPIFTQFDAIKIPEKEANLSYLKDYVKAIIYVNLNDLVNFKIVANAMLLNASTPDKLKVDIKSYLQKIGE